MRKIIIALLCIITSVSSFAELNSEQRRLRTDAMTFLREEGFQPELDKDGDIMVKIQGSTYYVSVSDSNTNPMYITLSSYHNYPSDYSTMVVKVAATELNLYKGVKVLCIKNSIVFTSQMYVRNAEPFKHAFYKMVSIMQAAEEDLMQECKNAQTELNEYCR